MYTLYLSFLLWRNYHFLLCCFVLVLAGNFVAIGSKDSPTIEIWDLDVVCKTLPSLC